MIETWEENGQIYTAYLGEGILKIVTPSSEEHSEIVAIAHIETWIKIWDGLIDE